MQILSCRCQNHRSRELIEAVCNRAHHIRPKRQNSVNMSGIKPLRKENGDVGAIVGAFLRNRGRRGARATVEAPVASSFKLARLQSFPTSASEPASQPGSQPHQPGSCLQRPHRGTVLVFVIVLSQSRHESLTHPRHCGKPSRACFRGRIPRAAILPWFRALVAAVTTQLPAIATTNNPHDDGFAQATGAADCPKYTIHVWRSSCSPASDTPG